MRKNAKPSPFTYCKLHEGGAYYLNLGIGLTIDSKTVERKGFIVGWNLALSNGEIYTGEDKASLLEKIHSLWPNLKQKTDITKEKVVIYTDNIRKVQGFFQKETTDSFENFFIEIDNFYEVRPCSGWFNENNALSIAKQAQRIIDDYFIPEKNFYLTPHQRNRKMLKKTKGEDITAKVTYPATFEKYQLIRNAYFGGLLYMPFTTIIEEPMLMVDINSSYIFDMLIESYPIKEPKRIKDTSNWEYYLLSKDKISIGCYKIHYGAPRSFISCYKDINGEKLKPGMHEVTMVLTSIDLHNFLKLGVVLSIEPIWIYEYSTSELPEYMIEAIVKAYIDKVTAKDKNEKSIRKPILNGFYGNTIRRYDTKEEFDDTRKDPAVSPVWGICTTAYAKKYLLKLALKIDGWFYSDTDSIICKDTAENRRLINAFNNEIRELVREFCDKHHYDFELLKDLGTFKVEAEITKLKIWACKTYCYKTVEGEIVLKAAGLVKDNVDINEDLFYEKELDYTRYSFPVIRYATEDDEGCYLEITPSSRGECHIYKKCFSDSMAGLY